jgi:hypothetical protein
MKLAIRIFAMSVVLVGVAAASVSSSTPDTLATQQGFAAKMPIPICTPGAPGCPELPPPTK